MRLMLNFAILGASLNGYNSDAAPRAAMVPVSVIMTNSHDGTAQLLSEEIRRQISISPAIKSSPTSEALYSLTIDDILIDKLGSREVILYDVILSFRGIKNVRLKGICYRRTPTVCSRKIVSKVEGFAASHVME